MRLPGFLTGLLLGAGTLLQAQVKPVAFEEFTLPNGLHVILHQDKSTPIVVTSVLYHVGSKNENPNRTGFAHFFEHLLFEGSKNIARGQFDTYISGAGGNNNAFTSQDITYYYEVLPSNQLQLALWLESERMLHANVDQKGVETQREVVKGEFRERYENQPYGTIFREVFARLFNTHPYQWLPIGSLEHINAASEQDYVNFYKTFYVPNNATLVVAGDIDPTQAKTWITQYFKDIPASKTPITRPSIKEPAMVAEVRDTVYDNIQLPAVIMGYRIPKQGSADSYALQMLSMLLAQGESSRMHKALVDQQQKAVAAGSFPNDLEDESVYIVYGICNLGIDPQDVEKSLDEEIESVQDLLVQEEEFQKLQNQIESNFVESISSLEGIAQSLAEYKVLYKNTNLINTELDKYLAVTREDLQRVAKTYLQKNNRVVLHYLPKAE